MKPRLLIIDMLVGSRDREPAAVSLRYMGNKIAQVMPVVDVVARIRAGAQS